jgi:hypothetical protein
MMKIYFKQTLIMKKLLLIPLFMLLGMSSVIGQTRDAHLARIDSTISRIQTDISDILFHLDSKQRYKLYPTENIYTFLRLDTKTGKIDQVQWSLDKEKEGSVSINKDDLSGFDYGSGRFELYPTKNMYQFILLDKT